MLKRIVAASVASLAILLSRLPVPSVDAGGDPVLVGAGDIASCASSGDSATARLVAGMHGNDTGVRAFWDVLYAAHADVIINGHDHDYERFGRQTPDGSASTSGIREFVVGTGGKDLRGFATVKPHSLVRNSTTFGVLR